MHFGSHHRAWIDPLPVQLDLILHEASRGDAVSDSSDSGPVFAGSGPTSVTLGAIAGDLHQIGFVDEPGP